MASSGGYMLVICYSIMKKASVFLPKFQERVDSCEEGGGGDSTMSLLKLLVKGKASSVLSSSSFFDR